MKSRKVQEVWTSVVKCADDVDLLEESNIPVYFSMYWAT